MSIASNRLDISRLLIMIAFYAPQLQRMPPKPRQMTLLPKFAAVLVTSSTPMCSIFNSVASCNNAFAFRYICCPRISGKIRPRTSFSRGVCLACVRLTGSRSNQEGPTFNPIACWYRWFCGICVGSPMARMARPARGRAGTRTKSRSGGPPGVFMFLSPRRCAHNPMQFAPPSVRRTFLQFVCVQPWCVHPIVE